VISCLPPKVLLDWEVGGPLEVQSLQDVIALRSALDPTPKVEDFVMVLFAQLEHAEIERDALFRE